jgi:hypothetical protein
MSESFSRFSAERAFSESTDPALIDRLLERFDISGQYFRDLCELGSTSILEQSPGNDPKQDVYRSFGLAFVSALEYAEWFIARADFLAQMDAKDQPGRSGPS